LKAFGSFEEQVSRAETRVARWHAFKPKIPNSGKFWRALQWKMLIYFTAFWYILWPFGLFYGFWVNFVVIWYIFSDLECFAKKNLATLAETQEVVVPRKNLLP
jgi:hypothetical protein